MTNLPESKYKVEQVIEGNQHFYDVTYNGKTTRYPGVTGMLSIINKPALINWAKKEALVLVETALQRRLNGKQSARITLNKSWIEDVLKDARKRPDTIKEEAADFGTQTHEIINAIIQGKEPSQIPDEILAPLNAFKDWWQNSGISLIAGEVPVASIEHGYGGCLDALGVKGDSYILIDVKTSSGFWPEYALQVAAYNQALKETYGIECFKAIILKLGKKLPISFEVKTVADLKLSLKAFLSAKALKESLSCSHFCEW
ncbi:MAG: hypothetical protein QW166_03495 [Candidatus Bathyarchaeia archaeon]